MFGEIFAGGDGQFGPFVEDDSCLGSGPALELGFDGPGEIGFAVFMEDVVCDVGVDFLGVYEEAVHVEEACSDWWKSENGLEGCVLWSGRELIYAGDAVLDMLMR